MEYLEQVRATIAANGMLHEGERVLVACSGGADSVALLRALIALGYDVRVAHFNHETRDGGSDADEAFVYTLCDSLDIEMLSTSADVATEAREAGESFETCARRLRYDFFSECAVLEDCTAIATGHHADDQAETVLFRLLRGTGTRGLAGIPPLRPLGGLRVIRPLLECRRAAIEAWLRALGQDWRDDASNNDPRYFRNRIRHRLLPLLRAEYNPGIDDALLRLAAQCRIEQGFMDEAMAGVRDFVAEGTDDIPRAAFVSLPLAVQHRFVSDYAAARSIELGYDRVTAAAAFLRDAATGAYFDLDAARQWYAGRNAVSLVSRGETFETEEAVLPIPGSATLLGRLFVARVLAEVPSTDYGARCSDTRQCFDANALGAEIILRTRRNGDRIAPLGLGGTKKLKDWFIGAGIPAPARGRMVLPTHGNNILWIPGGPVAESVAITPATTRVAEVEILDAVE
jgi:tRNA(Ile)-lysidine synthase